MEQKVKTSQISRLTSQPIFFDTGTQIFSTNVQWCAFFSRLSLPRFCDDESLSVHLNISTFIFLSISFSHSRLSFIYLFAMVRHKCILSLLQYTNFNFQKKISQVYFILMSELIARTQFVFPLNSIVMILCLVFFSFNPFVCRFPVNGPKDVNIAQSFWYINYDMHLNFYTFDYDNDDNTHE